MYMVTVSTCILIQCFVYTQSVTFNKPPPGGATLYKPEDTTGGIYPLDADDPSGNIPIFSILSQTPSTPVFAISSNDELTVPREGIDAETTTEFIFTFRVTAGSNTATSDVLTLRVIDVNDNDPVFLNTPYTGEVWKNQPTGTVITTVTARDPDISHLTVTYSISGSQTAFAINSRGGEISVNYAAGLASLSSPTEIQVQASDGARTGSAAVTITVHGSIVNFIAPPPGGAVLSVPEDTTGGIYPLDVRDPSGNVPILSILTQLPSTPVFTINSGDELTVPSEGLDAETTTEFNFTFSVTAGSNTAISDLLTLHVTDVNDNDPVFSNTPYTGDVWKNDAAGTVIIAVTARDPDISNSPITYSISEISGGGIFRLGYIFYSEGSCDDVEAHVQGSQTTIAVYSDGTVYVSKTAGLSSLSNPTVTQVLASDGQRTGSAAVTITVHDDPCSSGPCQNGGTCNSDRGNYNCICLPGYIKEQCHQDATSGNVGDGKDAVVGIVVIVFGVFGVTLFGFALCLYEKRRKQQLEAIGQTSGAVELEPEAPFTGRERVNGEIRHTDPPQPNTYETPVGNDVSNIYSTINEDELNRPNEYETLHPPEQRRSKEYDELNQTETSQVNKYEKLNFSGET